MRDCRGCLRQAFLVSDQDRQSVLPSRRDERRTGYEGHRVGHETEITGEHAAVVHLDAQAPVTASYRDGTAVVADRDRLDPAAVPVDGAVWPLLTWPP